MLQILHVLTTMLVALALSLALAHALELPGKMPLSKEAYLTVQSYPGFTIAGGIGEPGGVLATLALWLLTPRETTAFWLNMGAVVGLLAMQVVFWTITQPVNKVWVRSQQLSPLGAAFFSVGPSGAPAADSPDWAALRDRWEVSHVVRAGCAGVSFILLVISAVRGRVRHRQATFAVQGRPECSGTRPRSYRYQPLRGEDERLHPQRGRDDTSPHRSRGARTLP